jgi:hypothetical protein
MPYCHEIILPGYREYGDTANLLAALAKFEFSNTRQTGKPSSRHIVLLVYRHVAAIADLPYCQIAILPAVKSLSPESRVGA